MAKDRTISRRNFLKGVAGSLVAGSILSMSELAFAQRIVINAMVRNYTLEGPQPYLSAVEKFKQMHPNVNVELDGLGYSDQRLQTLIRTGAGRGPDITQFDTIWLGEYVEGGIVIDITDMVEDWDEINDWLPPFRNSAKWPLTTGRTYGVWLNSDVRNLVWNKKMFAEAGLDPERPPQTWSELIAVGKRLSKPPNVWGFVFPAISTDDTADAWYPWLWQGGGEILTTDLNRAEFNSRAGIDALQLWVDHIEEGITPLDVLSGREWGDLNSAFIAGKYAMAEVVGTVFSGAVSQGFDRKSYLETFGIGPLPLPPGGS